MRAPVFTCKVCNSWSAACKRTWENLQDLSLNSFCNASVGRVRYPVQLWTPAALLWMNRFCLGCTSRIQHLLGPRSASANPVRASFIFVAELYHEIFAEVLSTGMYLWTVCQNKCWKVLLLSGVLLGVWPSRILVGCLLTELGLPKRRSALPLFNAEFIPALKSCWHRP